MTFIYKLKKWKKQELEWKMEFQNSGYNLAGFDHLKDEILEEMKGVKHKYLKDMDFRLELAYDEVVDILEIKYIDESTFGYVLPVGIYKFTDKNSMINSLLTNEVKVNISIDDIRLRTNVTFSKTINFIKKSIFKPY